MMRRFFFHFHDGVQLEEDRIGLELTSAEQAYLEAIGAAQEMWPDLMKARIDPLKCAFEIAGEEGKLLFRIDFTELLQGCGSNGAAFAGSNRLAESLAETHRRALTARTALNEEFAQVRRALDQFVGTIGQLDRLSPSTNPVGSYSPGRSDLRPSRR